jgi:hypothetical protein
VTAPVLDGQYEAATARADVFEAARDRMRRLRTEVCYSDRLAGMFLDLAYELAEDETFCAAVDKHLDGANPKPGVYATCAECGQHGGHTMLCRLKPACPQEWIAVSHEVTIGSQPDVIRNPVTYMIEHLPAGAQ